MNIRPDWSAEAGASAFVTPARAGEGFARAFHGLGREQMPAERWSSLAVAIGAHLLLGWLIVFATMTVIKPAPREETITVTLAPTDPEQAPVPPPPVPVMPRLQAVAPPDIAPPTLEIAAAPPAPVETAAVTPPAPSAPPAQKAPTAPDVTPPRFDAAYLENPAVYPNMSRRLRETGTVQLRVRVSADGRPLEILMAKSSAYPRLDTAALEAVRKWKFQPAMRGGAPLEAWVLVPIEFSLTRG